MTKTRLYFDASYFRDTGDMFSMLSLGEESFWIVTGTDGGSSTEAEWLSAITAIELAVERGLTDVVLVGDSENVIKAMRGTRDAHRVQAVLMERARELGSGVPGLEWDHISSKLNPAGALIRRRLAADRRRRNAQMRTTDTAPVRLGEPADRLQ